MFYFIFLIIVGWHMLGAKTFRIGLSFKLFSLCPDLGSSKKTALPPCNHPKFQASSQNSGMPLFAKNRRVKTLVVAITLSKCSWLQQEDGNYLDNGFMNLIQLDFYKGGKNNMSNLIFIFNIFFSKIKFHFGQNYFMK